MFYQVNWLDTPSAISSPGSVDGPTRSSSQAGQQTNPSGPGAVPVNLSARQAKAAGLLTSGTYGQRSTGLSASADLSMFLGSRLQERLERLGSTLYRLTWRQKTTPAGLPFYQLVASVPRISASDCSGWPTPTTRDYRSERATAEWLEQRLADPKGKSLPMIATHYPMAVRLTASGQTLTGSDAGMESGGQLNPALSRFLQGYPTGWHSSEDTETL